MLSPTIYMPLHLNLFFVFNVSVVVSLTLMVYLLTKLNCGCILLIMILWYIFVPHFSPMQYIHVCSSMLCKLFLLYSRKNNYFRSSHALESLVFALFFFSIIKDEVGKYSNLHNNKNEYPNF